MNTAAKAIMATVITVLVSSGFAPRASAEPTVTCQKQITYGSGNTYVKGRCFGLSSNYHFRIQGTCKNGAKRYGAWHPFTASPAWSSFVCEWGTGGLYSSRFDTLLL